MSKKLYALPALFFPLFLLAQTNYKAGVIVDLKGDTLRGLINYREWNQNPETIDFKFEVNSEPQHLGAKAIQYFGINGYEYYRAYTVNVSLNTTELQKLTAIPDTTTKTDTVFLKILQSGKNATLFSYTDKLKERFYIADNADGKPEELKYLLYLNPDNNENLVTRRLYQGQLSVVAGNHHVDISGDLAATQYDEHSLAKIVSKINGSQSKLSMKNKQSSIRFFGGLAAGNSTLSFNNGGGVNVSGLAGSSGSAFSPQLTFGFDSYLNPNVGRLVIRAELSVSSSSYNIGNTQIDAINSTNTRVTQQLNQYDIAIGPLIIYNFYNSSALKAYLGAGLKANFPMYPTNKYTTVVTATNTASTVFYSTSTEYQMNSFYVSIPIKAGLVINRNVDIYVAYYLSDSITNYIATNGHISSYQLGLNYFFGK